MAFTMRVRTLLAATATVAAAALAMTVAPVEAQTKWTYYGRRGPAFWGSLDPAWRTCDTGKRQTPINMVFTKGVPRTSLSTMSKRASVGKFLPKAVQNGYKYDCKSDSCGTARWAGKNYEFVQFHMHLASEHTLDGAVMPAEIHLVHASADGDLLVIGVMIKVGSHNTLLTKMLRAAEKAVTQAKPAKFAQIPIKNTEWDSMVASSRGFCHYSGSLTTPPCSEGVTWIVSKKVITASISQLARLARSLLDSDSVVMTERPTQPLNGRKVTCYGS